jgi:thioredoxin reductase (NADPH)
VLEIKGSGAKDALKEIVMQGDSLKAKAVIVAVGSKSRWLKVPGEKELLNKGVHFCATCDGPVYAGKDVAVIGSDGRALDEAIYLASVAKKVTLISPKKDLEAEQAKIDMLKEKKISVMRETSVVSFKGKDFLEEIMLKSNSGKQSILFASGAFIYVGTDPNTEFVNAKKEQDGRILISQKMETSENGIFAAGDCIKKELNQVATCVGEGAIAAHSAAKLIQGKAGNQWA